MHKSKLLFAAIFTSFFASQLASAEPVKYQLESNHAFVVWSASHFGFSDQMGKFPEITGEIIFDEKKMSESSVDATIKIDSLVTGSEKFDAHLKSADFFDVKKFPTAKFVSKKVTATGENKAKVEGELTLHGVTKTVILEVKINKKGTSLVTQKETVGFSATAQIKRSEFGIDYAAPGISDEVKLKIEVEANK